MSCATFEQKAMAGAQALGMLCSLYRSRALPPVLEPLAREILQLSGDLADVENGRREAEAREAALRG